MRKKIIILTIIVVIVLLGVTVFVAFDINPLKRNQQIDEDSYFTKTIEIATAEQGNLQNSISTKGTIDSVNSTVEKSPVNAKVDEILVENGSKVEKGDTLAILNTESLQNEYDELYKEWVQAKAHLGNMKQTYTYVRIIATQEGEVTENNLSRNQNTEDILKEKEYLLAIKSGNSEQIYSDDIPNGEITKINYLSAVGRTVESGDLLFIVKVENADFNNQVEKVENLEKELEIYKNLLKNPEIKAKENCIISDVKVSTGQYCEKGTVLIEMKPTEEIEVKIAVTKDELRKVSQDKEALVTLDSGVKLTGFVNHISYSPNDNDKYLVTIKINDTLNADFNDILPGLKANVDIILEEKEDVVKVPVDAVKSDNKGEYVLVYTGNMEDVNTYTVDTVPTEKRYVEKGMVTSLYVEIINGVSAGEKVVVVSVSKNENDFFSGMIGY